MTIRIHKSKMKAEVALLAIKQEETIADLSQRFGLHASLIHKWKAEALSGMEGIFSKDKKADIELKAKEKHISDLEKKIGQLVVENDYLKKNYGSTLK